MPPMAGKQAGEEFHKSKVGAARHGAVNDLARMLVTGAVTRIAGKQARERNAKPA